MSITPCTKLRLLTLIFAVYSLDLLVEMSYKNYVILPLILATKNNNQSKYAPTNT